jgi:hypothetical protein
MEETRKIIEANIVCETLLFHVFVLRNVAFYIHFSSYWLFHYYRSF